MDFPSPTGPALSLEETFLQYLDYFRERVIEKVVALPLDALIVSVVPTDWTALELVKHLTYVEMRWLEWGYEGHTVDEPWGDHFGDRWRVGPGDTRDSLVHDLRERGLLTTTIVLRHDLDERGRPGPRWEDAEPATMQRILFHLVGEYARHLGHLDIYSELADGSIGE